MKGNIFESFAITEIIKEFYNNGQDPNVYFWRDKYNHEVDCIIQYGTKVIAIEMKAKRTSNSKIFGGINFWNNLHPKTNKSYVVFAGNKDEKVLTDKRLISWQNIYKVIEDLIKL